MDNYRERRLEQIARRAEAAAMLALLAASLAHAKPRRKSIGDRLWDLL